jgi:hypothetical protein
VVQEKLAALELSRATLERELAASPDDDAVASYPALPGRFRKLVERLNAALAEADTPERLAARQADRDLIRQVVVTPAEERGQFAVTAEMEMAALVAQDGHLTTVGAGTGFERSPTLIDIVFAA